MATSATGKISRLVDRKVCPLVQDATAHPSMTASTREVGTAYAEHRGHGVLSVMEWITPRGMSYGNAFRWACNVAECGSSLTSKQLGNLLNK